MRRTQWVRISLVLSILALLLFAGASLWTLSTQSAFARSPKPKPPPTPTATLSPTPTPTPSGPPTPTPTPLPVTGSWQVFPSPTIDVSQSTWGAKLDAVAVVSASDVWAVGYAPVPGGPLYAKATLIEHFDGTSWSIVPSPNPASVYSEVELDGVFALSASDVWAVGYGDNPPGTVSPLDITLIEHFDGTSWSIVPSPNPDQDENQLHAVAGVAANDVWAVGQRGDGDTCCAGAALIEHWNGTSWSVAPNPGLNSLFGVTALAANNVWAVAVNNNNLSSGDAIVEHFDGATWSNVAAPDVDDLGDRIFLRAIAAESPSDIWAVGNVTDSLNNEYYSVTEHWDGTSWKITGLNLEFSVLDGVVATAPADAWSVDGIDVSQSEHFDGVTWSRFSLPQSGAGSGLYGVAAVSSGDIWAVGFSSDSAGHDTPLIEQFTQS